MKSLVAVLILATVVGCSTKAPSPKTEAPQAAAVHVPVATELKLDRVVVRAVHGQVQYWDGNLWTGLRPNMVLTNGLQIRPGADSSVDLCGDHCVTMRLMADDRQTIKAFLISRTKGASGTATAPSSGSRVISSSVQEPSSSQIPARVVKPSPAPAVVIGADWKVRVITGEMILTGNGKTYLLRDGQYFDVNTSEVRGEIGSKPGLTLNSSANPGPTGVISTPRPVLFDAGLESARQGICWIGE